MLCECVGLSFIAAIRAGRALALSKEGLVIVVISQERKASCKITQPGVAGGQDLNPKEERIPQTGRAVTTMVVSLDCNEPVQRGGERIPPSSPLRQGSPVVRLPAVPRKQSRLILRQALPDPIPTPPASLTSPPTTLPVLLSAPAGLLPRASSSPQGFPARGFLCLGHSFHGGSSSSLSAQRRRPLLREAPPEHRSSSLP